MAVFMAVVPEGRPALAAQTAQILSGAVRATQQAVGDAVQLARVWLEGLAGTDRAQGDVAAGGDGAPGPGASLGPAAGADPSPLGECPVLFL
jgi:hypothetical protein